jgi:hypothetical protein
MYWNDAWQDNQNAVMPCNMHFFSGFICSHDFADTYAVPAVHHFPVSFTAEGAMSSHVGLSSMFTHTSENHARYHT